MGREHSRKALSAYAAKVVDHMVARCLVLVLWSSLAFVTGACHRPITTDKDAQIAATGAALPAVGGALCERLEANRFRVSIPCVQHSAVKQRMHSQWCWAACAEVILRARGDNITQEKIASPFVGQDLDEGVCPLFVMRAINPDLEQQYRTVLFDEHGHPGLDELGRMTRTAGVGGGITSDWLISELSEGEPAVVGLREKGASEGHVCVVYGATYSQAAEPSGVWGWFVDGFKTSSLIGRVKVRYVLHSVDLIDPDPDAAMYTTISAKYLQENVELLMTRRLARSMILEMIQKGPAQKTYRTTRHLEVGVGTRKHPS